VSCFEKLCFSLLRWSLKKCEMSLTKNICLNYPWNFMLLISTFMILLSLFDLFSFEPVLFKINFSVFAKSVCTISYAISKYPIKFSCFLAKFRRLMNLRRQFFFWPYWLLISLTSAFVLKGNRHRLVKISLFRFPTPLRADSFVSIIFYPRSGSGYCVKGMAIIL